MWMTTLSLLTDNFWASTSNHEIQHAELSVQLPKVETIQFSGKCYTTAEYKEFLQLNESHLYIQWEWQREWPLNLVPEQVF